MLRALFFAGFVILALWPREADAKMFIGDLRQLYETTVRVRTYVIQCRIEPGGGVSAAFDENARLVWEEFRATLQKLNPMMKPEHVLVKIDQYADRALQRATEEIEEKGCISEEIRHYYLFYLEFQEYTRKDMFDIMY